MKKGCRSAFGNPFVTDRLREIELFSQEAVILATGFTTAPDRMQPVQTRIRLLLPSETATFTLCKFGSQRLLLLLWA
jgi:hypothetical protein